MGMIRSAGAAASADVSLRVRQSGWGGYNADREGSISTYKDIDLVKRYPIVYPALTDIKCRVDAITTNSNVYAHMQFEIEKLLT